MIKSNNFNSVVEHVVSTSNDELLLHGIRIKDKTIVVELASINDEFQSDQLHVGPLSDADGLISLEQLDDSFKHEYGSKIFYSLAQALKFFLVENTCTLDLSLNSIYIGHDFDKIYLTSWSKSSGKDINSAGSIEQIYIDKLTRLYAFLVTSIDLNKITENLENENWDKNHLKHRIQSLDINSELKSVFYKGLQIDGNMCINIDALVLALKSYFYIPNPKGVMPFMASIWIAFSSQITLAASVLIAFYAHTVA